MFFLMYFTTANFMSVDFLIHFIMRTAFYWLGLIIIIHGRNQYDENNVLVAACLSFLIELIIESALYVHHRSKARLFMRLKVMTL